MLQFNEIMITFTAAVFFGMLLIFLARKLRIPSIVTLLIGGIIAGSGRYGLGIVNPDSLGDGLQVIVQLGVGVILFEGGLTLNVSGYRLVSKEIRRALTLGVLATWIGTAGIIALLYGYSPAFSLMAASLVIVTGPTVIGPILKRINAKKNIHDYLHWESILVDPIGVFISLLCYEWIVGEYAVGFFFLRLAFGIVIGLASGFILRSVIVREWIPDDIFSVFILGCALAIMTVSNTVVPDSGLLSVTIAGLFVGYARSSQIERLKSYKSQLVELLIGLLFVLLSANLDIASFHAHFGVEMALAVCAVIFLVRPLNVFISAAGKNFRLKEKLFLSWVAPRGIVAASMASLFAIILKKSPVVEDPAFIEAFTYVVIACTVVLQGFTAPQIGKLLGVLEPEATGWAIIPAHRIARATARFITGHGGRAVLIDTNIHAAAEARRNGLDAVLADALTVDPEDFPALYGIGNVLAVTANQDLNELICQHWARVLRQPRLYRWSTRAADESSRIEKRSGAGRIVWSGIRLQLPVGTDVSDEASGIMSLTTDAGSLSGMTGVLFCASKEKLYPFVPDGLTGECDILALRWIPVKQKLPIKPQWMILSDSTTIRQVIAELLDILKMDFPGLPVGEILERLIRIEMEYSSVVSNQVALPHTYVNGIDQSIVMLARMRSPITCEYSSEPIMVVFLVLSPRENPDMHIRTLALISRTITDAEIWKRIMEAGTSEEIAAVLDAV